MQGVSDAEQFERSTWNGDRRPPFAKAVVRFPHAIEAADYTAVPNRVLDDNQLSPDARLVYILLRRLAETGSGLIDERELARRIGIPAHRIPRQLALLERRGLLRIDGRPGNRDSTRYWLEKLPAHNEDPSIGLPAVRVQSRSRRAIRGKAGLSLVDRLIIMGVDPRVAGRLVSSYPRERVAGALRAVHRRRPRPRDPAAVRVPGVGVTADQAVRDC